ncbi:hypothetical protein CBS101457_001527 [Exobasidium rhododendri]|nr:hypothetical protein CBS101457_001527 [Exobasidium rhododendri]
MAASKSELTAAHKRYDEALALKSNNLPALDKWYRYELQSTLQTRQSDEKGALLTSKELVKLMKWKLTRGKFRPRLEQLAESNSDDFVQSQSKKALAQQRESESITSAKASLLTLNTLRGVGPATSSAILAAFSPKSMPFMSDEALEAAVALAGKPKYTVKEWEWYTKKMQERVKEEGWEGGVGELEAAAWAYVVLKRHNLLDKNSVTTTTAKHDEKSELGKYSERSPLAPEEPTPSSSPRKRRKVKR